MARQQERREATRAALIAAARRCFREQGYDATSLDAVLAHTELSKGALYHHFAGKTELLAAVFDAVSRETLERAQKASAGAPAARDRLATALKGWLRAVLAPEPRRIILETGPAVLGLARARAIEEAVIQPAMREAIKTLIVEGQATCEDVALVARLLTAAVGEMALIIVERGQDDAPPEAFGLWIDTLMATLLPARQTRADDGR